MDTNSHPPESNEEFEPFVSEDEISFEEAAEVAKRLGLDTLEELLDTNPLVVGKALALFEHKYKDDEAFVRRFISLVIGVIPEQEGGYWLFFRQSDDIFEGADAIEIKLDDPQLDDTDPENITVNFDMWNIVWRQPLLLSSMYADIRGFRREGNRIVCEQIQEGYDGWS
jgi:hypothetical protein